MDNGMRVIVVNILYFKKLFGTVILLLNVIFELKCFSLYTYVVFMSILKIYI